jgi:hypothetical protein
VSALHFPWLRKARKVPYSSLPRFFMKSRVLAGFAAVFSLLLVTQAVAEVI